MKIKEKKTVMQQLRDIRDKMSEEIKDMTTEQMKEYFENQKTLHPLVWQQSR